MANTVYVSDVIDAPIEKVWGLMRDFNDMPSYHPGDQQKHHRGRGPQRPRRMRAPLDTGGRLCAGAPALPG